MARLTRQSGLPGLRGARSGRPQQAETPSGSRAASTGAGGCWPLSCRTRCFSPASMWSSVRCRTVRWPAAQPGLHMRGGPCPPRICTCMSALAEYITCISGKPWELLRLGQELGLHATAAMPAGAMSCNCCSTPAHVRQRSCSGDRWRPQIGHLTAVAPHRSTAPCRQADLAVQELHAHSSQLLPAACCGVTLTR